MLGHLILVQARAALADLVAADRHIAAAERLADRHGLPLVAVFSEWYAALRLAVAGQRHEARSAYRAAAARLTGTGMTGLTDGILPLALLCLDSFDAAPATADDADLGPYEPWARAGTTGSATGPSPTRPRDLLFEARSCLHALVAVRTGDRPAMERLYAELLPAAAELAGAGSGLLVVGPTAQHLGHLASRAGPTRRRRRRTTGRRWRSRRRSAHRTGPPPPRPRCMADVTTSSCPAVCSRPPIGRVRPR